MIGIYPVSIQSSSKKCEISNFTGIQIACHDFTKNLPRYAPEGSVGLFVAAEDTHTLRKELEAYSAIEGGNTLTTNVWELHSIPSVLKDNEITAFHNPTGPQLNKLAYLRAQFSETPFPITGVTHGFSVQFLLFEFFARLWLTPTLPCDSIICTSIAAKKAFKNLLEQSRECLKELGCVTPDRPVRLDLLPLGVDTDQYRPRDKNDARIQLGLPQKKTILLYFGRIDHTAKADLNPLLLAFKELARKYGNELILLFAGNATTAEVANLQSTCARLGIGDQVYLRAQPTLVEGPLFYAAADIFVALSDTPQESFGLSILEAMASSLPVVAADWSGYRETVVHQETGFLVPTLWGDVNLDVEIFSPLHDWTWDHVQIGQSIATDLKELIKDLDTLIESPVLRSKMGQAARSRVVAKYSWDVVISQYIALWNDLAEIANGLHEWQRPHFQIEQPRYFDSFGHFSTNRLVGTTSLTLTEWGREALSSPDSIVLHDDMRTSLSTEMLVDLLLTTKNYGGFGSVDSISASIASRSEMSTSSIRRHVLWLIKYGLLEAQ